MIPRAKMRVKGVRERECSKPRRKEIKKGNKERKGKREREIGGKLISLGIYEYLWCI